MIDYVKIKFINIDIARLLNLPCLEFKTVVSEQTGELSGKTIAEYKHCKITVYDSGVVLFTGSIHKLWNELKGNKAPNYNQIKPYKGFNGNQFTLDNILEVRKYLENLFDCEPQQMIIQNIEFGVNTTPIFTPNIFIKGLLYHKNIMFEFRHTNRYAQVNHQRYIIKIYNKSNQYGMNYHVLRVELKIVKMEDVNGFGITTFADINSIVLNKAKELLLKRFGKVMHYDYTIRKKELSKPNKEHIKNYRNARYWIDLKPNNRHRHRIILLKITRNNSEKLHQQIHNEIIKKCSIINRLSNSANCSIINRSYIGLILPQSTPKKCLVTGIDISMQKHTSFLLSHTGLKHLYKHNRLLFECIKEKYIYNKYKNADFQTQIIEIYHGIRDAWGRSPKKKVSPKPTHYPASSTEKNCGKNII